MTNHIILHFILIFDAHLLLVASARENIIRLTLSLLGDEGFLGKCDACGSTTLISYRVSCTLVEFVMIAELVHVLLVH